MRYSESRESRAINYLIANRELIALIVLSSVTAMLFVFDGFATGDSARYALALESIEEKGIVQMPHVFHGGMSFGYYLLLGLLVKLMGDSVSLSSLMNSFNAAISVVLLCILFLFFNALSSDKKLSFFACLMVMLAPSIWFLSHYGHPALLSLTFLIASLFVYDKIVCGTHSNPRSGLLWLVFVTLATLALAIRLNNVLAFGASFGLLHFRNALSVRNFSRTIGVLLLVLCLVFGLNYLVLGYLMNPVATEITPHVATRLGAESVIARNIMKNITLWVMSANVLIVLCAALGVIHLGPNSRLGVLFMSWIVPWCVFLPFGGIDFARIAAPTVPILALVAASFVTGIFIRRQVLALSLMLILSQVISVAMYYPLVKIYPFSYAINGRVLAEVPVGFLPQDHYYRQQAAEAIAHFAGLVASERSEHVMIVGSAPSLPQYRFYLMQSRNVVLSERYTCEEVTLDRYVTDENEFIMLCLFDYDNRQVEYPIRKALDCLDRSRTKVHVVPFWRAYPTSEEEVFLTKEGMEAVLDREAMITDDPSR